MARDMQDVYKRICMSNNPLISIVTPSLNQKDYIERTILSVMRQDYEPFEHIIMDGGSSDGTVEILKKYSHLKWVSEKDTGQSDAINKGFRMAKGEICAYINSDDVYLEGAFHRIVKAFDENPNVGLVYSHCLHIDENDHITGLRRCPEYRNEYFIKDGRNIIDQPTAFWRSDLFDKIGYFDESMHYAMDFDFWLRTAKITDMMLIPDKILAAFRVWGGGKSYSDIEAKFWEERLRSFFRNGGSRFSKGYYQYLRWKFIKRPRRALKRLLGLEKRKKYRMIKRMKDEKN